MMVGYIVLVVIQLFIFFLYIKTDKKNISIVVKENVKKMYVVDSILIIVYLIVFSIYILSRKSGFYSDSNAKLMFIVCFVVIISSNVAKIMFQLRKDVDVNSLMFFILMLLHIEGVACQLLVLISVFNTFSYVPYDNRNLVEQNSFNRVELRKTDDKKQYNPYEIIVIDDNNEYILDLANNKLNVCYNEKSYIQKYEIKEIEENCFENEKINIYYEYVIYTPDETERNFISLYYNSLIY